MATRNSKAKVGYLNSKGEKALITDKVASVVFSFAHGTEMQVNLSELPKDIIAAAATRGIAEKIRDTYAGSATSQDAEESAKDIVAQLMEGEWASAREGGTGVRSTMLLAAMQEAFEVKGMAFDAAAQRAKLYQTDDDTDETKAAKATLRSQVAKVPEVATVLDRLRAEAAAKRAAKEPEGPQLGLDDLA